MSLLWRVQNIVVIGRIDLKLERSEFSSNFEFDRNMLSGTGARFGRMARGGVNFFPVVILHSLTLNVQGPSYLGFTRSISWLLLPWLFTSPGHQQPWYWLCRKCRPWSYLRKDFKYLSMWSNDIKWKYMIMFPLKNLARKGLTMWALVWFE